MLHPRKFLSNVFKINFDIIITYRKSKVNTHVYTESSYKTA